MNETKVSTNGGDVTSPVAKKSLLPRACVGGIEAGEGRA